MFAGCASPRCALYCGHHPRAFRRLHLSVLFGGRAVRARRRRSLARVGSPDLRALRAGRGPFRLAGQGDPTAPTWPPADRSDRSAAALRRTPTGLCWNPDEQPRQPPALQQLVGPGRLHCRDGVLWTVDPGPAQTREKARTIGPGRSGAVAKAFYRVRLSCRFPGRLPDRHPCHHRTGPSRGVRFLYHRFAARLPDAAHLAPGTRRHGRWRVGPPLADRESKPDVACIGRGH